MEQRRDRAGVLGGRSGKSAIDVEAGYGTTASDVPEPLKQAIRQLLAHWYENRGAGPPDESALRVPATVAALIAPYRVLAL